MIRQPIYGSRNVNDDYYRFEARMIEKLNEVLGDVDLTLPEERTLIWLAGWEECTINNLVSVIEKVARKRADEVGGNAHEKSNIMMNHNLTKPSAFESEIHPSHKPTVYTLCISPCRELCCR